MTSSLVGSEMCIRDSFLLPMTSLPTSATGTGRAVVRLAAGDAGAVNWNTVSYTHLTLPTICSV
eukprot:4386835-Prorocentrum_lima.AAC.1